VSFKDHYTAVVRTDCDETMVHLAITDSAKV
jgi:hypothetical protein